MFVHGGGCYLPDMAVIRTDMDGQIFSVKLQRFAKVFTPLNSKIKILSTTEIIEILSAK